MTEPLIDSEGYPRSDIDVYQVRHARHQIKCECLEPALCCSCHLFLLALFLLASFTSLYMVLINNNVLDCHYKFEPILFPNLQAVKMTTQLS